MPIPDLLNAAAHCAKRTIANLRSPSSLDTPLNEPRVIQKSVGHWAFPLRIIWASAAGSACKMLKLSNFVAI
jgi:hypothetical protein